jgi:histone H3/H4
MSDIINKRPVKRYVRDEGTDMVADDAAEKIVDLAEDYIQQIVDVSSDYTDTAGRVTLQEEDVEKAQKVMDSM